MAVVTVTLRFFAASRAATGLDELECVAEHEPTLGELIAGLAPARGTDPDELMGVLDRCSFLVDGISTRDRSQVVSHGAVVDVMPPFAGG
ncbi:putative molybdenum cofactor biosynthesis protein D2 / thiamineS [Frondihabitans sucicola]|uniref:Molybdenum cofactor biosynthesis protein D2 / thiamineS n=1 Tax=Frondihabitans sucicola TaxID=1268041 RepID=A0ABN6Y108_9MICO|nr:MoaD/ThiS family protein [Frondihabitans sucicola]BDZ49560.1 putative molybdenum cofactor biosynthesis protein D2 / thiamineS [Frondihabitans sucicola]